MAHPAIDMVFTYVDGADPELAARRQAAARALGLDGPGREVWYRDVGEITYAVRSALAAMPWIGTIHIVTDGQIPPVDANLLESGRVRIVDHTSIVPAEYRPVFASTIIESFLHRIPGLTDVWLYDNDDFLHGGGLAPGEFVEMAPDGSMRLHLRTAPALLRLAIAQASDLSPGFLPRANSYTAGIANAARLIRRHCRLPWRDIVFPRHVTQVYRTATARRVEGLFAEELHAARLRRFRGVRQISWSTLCYSAECHFAGGLKVGPALPFLGDDALFVDFGLGRSAAGRARAWERVAASRARFICLNNIPADEADAFRRAMAARGLSRPGEPGP